MSRIRIIWNDEGADEDHDTKYIDLIPLWLLEVDGVRDNVSHQVVGPRGGLAIARCSVRAEGKFVYIDYEPYYNKGSGEHIPGVLRLEFTGEDRSGVPKVSWRNRGESDFKSGVATAEFDVSARIESSEIDDFDDAGQFDPSGVKDQRDLVIAAIKRRRGQPRFREELMRAYSRRCAFTNCAVEQVLEAAHIISYKGPDTNHVQNGLLLRADVHTLFDMQLVGVDVSGEAPIVVLHESIRREAAYQGLHGSKVLLPKNDADRPSRRALEQHFTTSGIKK